LSMFRCHHPRRRMIQNSRTKRGPGASVVTGSSAFADDDNTGAAARETADVCISQRKQGEVKICSNPLCAPAAGAGSRRTAAAPSPAAAVAHEPSGPAGALRAVRDRHAEIAMLGDATGQTGVAKDHSVSDGHTVRVGLATGPVCGAHTNAPRAVERRCMHGRSKDEGEGDKRCRQRESTEGRTDHGTSYWPRGRLHRIKTAPIGECAYQNSRR